MDIQFSVRNSTLFVTPGFERLDAAVAPEFKRLCVEAGAGARAMAIDLSKVRFIDSSGLGALAALLRTLGPGGSLALAAVQPSVRVILEISSLDQVVQIYERIEQVPA